jgi:uncharacterized damage-inducible protein DinB
MLIALHHNHDVPGVEAWVLDAWGFLTWAPTRLQAIHRLPDRLASYRAWCASQCIALNGPSRVLRTTDYPAGELLFDDDRDAATPELIAMSLKLMEANRRELLRVLTPLPEGALDWDPPYTHFDPEASWRTIRANLQHLATAEVHYFCAAVGHRPAAAPPTPDVPWRAALAASRAESAAFLRSLTQRADLVRYTEFDVGRGPEQWTLRKALRRMVSHERTHLKSIRRIAGILPR